MKIHRFIVDKDLYLGNFTVSDKEIVNQITKVLRLKQGDFILLSDGKKEEAKAQITKILKGGLEVEILDVFVNKNEPSVNVILYCAMLKKENFELVVQKATEVGVKEIVPVITKRTVKTGFKKDRLEKIIKEACKQSGRGMIPKLHDPVGFEDAVKNAGDQNLFFDSSGAKLQTTHYKLQTINVWIGPEGGWDESELNLAKESGFKITSLGNLILRAETAAIISS